MEGKNTPIKRNLEASDVRIRIDSPSYEEFNNSDFESFIQKAILQWRENHKRLLRVVKSGKFPFFGMHGTSGSNLSQILKDQRGNFEMATFYEKDKTEEFLYGLYHASFYTSSYAHDSRSQGKPGRDPGGILVFNLEKEGKNMTWEWERLFPGALITSLSFDKKDEGKAFESLRERENLLCRTEDTFSPEVFSHCFKGVIKMSDLEKYFTPLTTQDTTTIARTVIRIRLLSQEILARAFELLNPEPKTV